MAGVVHERAGDGHALALAARELVGAVAEPRAELHPFQRLGGAPAALGRGHAGVDQRQLDVLQRLRARQQVERLEDEADLAVALVRQRVVAHRRDELPVQPVHASVGRVEGTDQVHERRLARAQTDPWIATYSLRLMARSTRAARARSRRPCRTRA
jgi:hypothetical protein